MARTSLFLPAALSFACLALVPAEASAAPSSPYAATAAPTVDDPTQSEAIQLQPGPSLRLHKAQRDRDRDAETTRRVIKQKRREGGWLIGAAFPAAAVGGYLVGGVVRLSQSYNYEPGPRTDAALPVGIATGLAISGVMVGFGAKRLHEAITMENRLHVGASASRHGAEFGVTLRF